MIGSVDFVDASSLADLQLGVYVAERPCKCACCLIDRNVWEPDVSKVQFVLKRSITGGRLVQEGQCASDDMSPLLHIHILPNPPHLVHHALQCVSLNGWMRKIILTWCKKNAGSAGLLYRSEPASPPMV